MSIYFHKIKKIIMVNFLNLINNNSHLFTENRVRNREEEEIFIKKISYQKIKYNPR